MPFVSRVEARAYSRATEVLDRVKGAVLNLYPPSTRESVKIETNSTTSHHQSTIVIVNAVLEKKKLCGQVLEYLLDSLSESDKRTLKKTLRKRLDEKCSLFLRLDKQAAFLGKIQLADSPDLINIRVQLIQYPRCIQDDAITTINKYLDIEGED
jgi:RNA binding exosome subunit